MKILPFKPVHFNDPIYGFITIHSPLIFKVISHPYFQRLRRISQMGLSFLVYPGANHTRFEHALGCMHLMQQTIIALKLKGVKISKEEEEALQIAILLHDVGHGPFSHALENMLIQKGSHEQLSLKILEFLNSEFNGALEMAVQIFNGSYPRKFMHQLISGQIDLDRLDYLKRDSFYTGAAEGNVNVQRIIRMMLIVDDELLFEEKGVFSLEKFLLARRLMYWQVYLHKTSLSAELLLAKAFERYREIQQESEELFIPLSLRYFLQKNVYMDSLSERELKEYLKIDDTDIYQALKVWKYSSDPILSNLAKRLLDRNLLKIKVRSTPFLGKEISKFREKFNHQSVGVLEAKYFVFSGHINNQTYVSNKDNIFLYSRKKEIVPLNDRIDYLDFKQFSQPEFKYYLCFPKKKSYS